jgi:UDP-N-acetylmuramate dehydrogenase
LTCISTNVALRQLNTFNVKAFAASFIQIDSLQQLKSHYAEISSYSERLILGGGSNLLFIGDYPGLVIYPQLKGIQVIAEDDRQVTLRVAASEVWHEFVCYCLDKGYFGLENLALIPGTVGAAPVQNIGAYGVEVEPFIRQIECFDLQQGELTIFSHDDCQFGYRDSLIKQAGQGHYLVTSVDFVLRKKSKLVLTYKPLSEYFANLTSVSPQQVFERVCQIRAEKLPDPAQLANAGSFFKNPVISQQHYQQLKQSFPALVAYPVDSEMAQSYKVAAGWLIEIAGFKGKVIGKVGVHKHQALVLVNYSDDDGSNILALAQTIMQAVKQMFGIKLEAEVRVLGQLVEKTKSTGL